VNRLSGETSPYLLQHKDNPVEWWPWGPEAFAEAVRRDVPVLLSVGYAACHWCHVMAHESFEDPELAATMNERFVNIKVDREERPDVDAVYMEVTQAMTGQGGWPMTVFLTPDGEPFYAGTYFPPTSRHGLPGFGQLLEAVSGAWRERRDEATAAGANIAKQLAQRSGLPPGEAPPTEQQLAAAVRLLAMEYDVQRGGFGGAPKFPPSMTLEHLLRHHARTGDAESRRMVEGTAEAMARGGMHDQLGGGFARYSVDAGWVVPHFEKMLYDNALLLRAYLHLWRATGSTLARRVATGTADWLLRDLRTPEGGFASALDADSEGVEGRYYAWAPSQLTDVLGEEDGTWAAQVWSVTEAGTFEHGFSVLQLRADPDDGARYASLRERLLEARAARVAPGRDDKVVAAWNGLAIAALAEAGALLENPAYTEAATAAAELVVSVHLDGPRLLRTSRDGRAGRNAGVLEDYGDVAEGFLALYATTGDDSWLALAGVLLDTALTHFADGQGGFFDTADDATDPQLRRLRRPQDPTDNATPSGQAALAGALLTYAAYTGSERHREAAEGALQVFSLLAERAPRFAGWGLAVAEALVDGPREVAVLGPPDHPSTSRLWRVALLGTAAGAAVAAGDPERPADVALLRDRPLVGGAPAAYVCRRFVCDAPVTEPSELARLVGARAEALS
jgi:uncharacterized protein YyaL (SSP411 family)